MNKRASQIKSRNDGYARRKRHWVCSQCLTHFRVPSKTCAECECDKLWLLDSDVEYKRYRELLWMESTGEISHLKPKEVFPLVVCDQYGEHIDIYNKKGAIRRSVPTYICDFSYQANGEQIVEDVKSKRWQADDPVYNLKSRLFRLIYGFDITIVRK